VFIQQIFYQYRYETLHGVTVSGAIGRAACNTSCSMPVFS